MKTVMEMRRARKALWEQTKAWMDAIESDATRSWDAAAEEEYAKRNADLDALDVEIERAEQTEARERRYVETHTGEFEEHGADDGETRDAQTEYEDLPNAAEIGVRATRAYSEAFESVLRGAVLGADTYGLLNSARATLQVDSDIGGGYFAASERFLRGLLVAVDDTLVLRKLVTRYTCGYGESLGQLTLDGDLADFEFGEGETATAAEDTGAAVGLRQLRPRIIKNKIVKISERLLNNPRINIEEVVQQRAAVRLANGLETAYMTGDGSKEPLGLFTASAQGISTSRDVSTDNTTTAITGDNLIEVQGTLAEQYQRNARWLLHRTAVTKAKKLKDGNGQYLWLPGLREKEPNLILGKPYVVGSKVPHTFTTGQYVGMYGDFRHYVVADAVSMMVQRLNELYAETNQIGLRFANMAADGMPMTEEAFVRIALP